VDEAAAAAALSALPYAAGVQGLADAAQAAQAAGTLQQARGPQGVEQVCGPARLLGTCAQVEVVTVQRQTARRGPGLVLLYVVSSACVVRCDQDFG
jgi:hypothetical protein